jgi:hypothetical protein
VKTTTRSDLVPLDWFPNEIAALAAAAALESAGVDCVVEREDAGVFSLPAPTRIFVAPQALTAAREILQDLQKGHTERSRQDRVRAWRDVSPETIACGLHEICKRRRRGWVLFFAFPVYASVALAAVGYLVPEEHRVLVWMGFCILYAVAVARATWAECPRCGNPYSSKRGFHSPWNQRCLHCGLPLSGPS